MSRNNIDDNNKLDHNDVHDDQMFISHLPKSKNWLTSGVSQYQGFWFPTFLLQSIINFQRKFIAQDQDIILVSKPKSGTTWLKALLFSIVNRTRFTPSNTPLLTSNPHQLVPFFESIFSKNPPKDVPEGPTRLFGTHVPYSVLPDSIRTGSGCRIVYISRNHLDAIVSFWHFTSQFHPDRDPDWSMESLIESSCAGRDGFGPFWDHELGFWKESLERPEKVLFLKYEDMKEDTESQVKKIAGFLGFPFSEEEEERGVVREICEMCSLESLKGFEMKNKHEQGVPNVDNRFFYRKGEVGGWANELCPSMVERVEKVIREKMKGSKLTF